MRALTAALAGATRPVDRHLDGIDISPFLLGHRETNGSDTFFHYAWTYLQAVRQGGSKLVIPRPANPPWTSWYGGVIDAAETPKLYHLAADNSEPNNLAAHHPGKVAELTRLYQQTRNELGGYCVWYTNVARQNDNYPSGYNGSLWSATSPGGHQREE